VTSYNDDGADSFEESEDDMTPNHWDAAEEDTGPIIDKILDHRPKDGDGNTTDIDAMHSLTHLRARSFPCAEEGL
jgi:chromodomain-helicase-DNA-binding protein 1